MGESLWVWGHFDPGGTFLLLHTEDAELVRRRGRWVTSKVCEIYLQEVLYTTYTEKQNRDVQQRIADLAGAFPQILQVAGRYLQTGLPQSTWYQAFQEQDHKEHVANGVGGTSRCFWPKWLGRSCWTTKEVLKSREQSIYIYIYLFIFIYFLFVYLCMCIYIFFIWYIYIYFLSDIYIYI